MKHIKKFNEGFFDFLKGGKSSSSSDSGSTKHTWDYSSINKEDNSLIL